MSVTQPDHPRSGGDPDREAEAGRGNGDDGQGGQGGAHAAPAPSGGAAMRTMLRETVIVVGMALLLSLIVKTWLLRECHTAQPQQYKQEQNHLTPQQRSSAQMWWS